MFRSEGSRSTTDCKQRVRLAWNKWREVTEVICDEKVPVKLKNNIYKTVIKPTTVVQALGDPCRERPPAVYGHVINVPTHFKVTLPAIDGHLPNADADSHLLVVRTCISIGNVITGDYL